MPFIETVSLSEATGDVRNMYERQEQSFGYLPNYALVFCHRPEIMGLWAKLLSGIRRNLDRRRFELATLAAALELRSSYCSLAHGRALTEYLSPEDVRAIAAGADVASVSAAERAMMDFARQVARDARAVTREQVEALRAHGFSDAEVFDVAAVAAARAFLTKLVDGLGAEPDSVFLDMEEAFRSALTVGRPIATRARERLYGFG